MVLLLIPKLRTPSSEVIVISSGISCTLAFPYPFAKKYPMEKILAAAPRRKTDVVPSSSLTSKKLWSSMFVESVKSSVYTVGETLGVVVGVATDGVLLGVVLGVELGVDDGVVLGVELGVELGVVLGVELGVVEGVIDGDKLGVTLGVAVDSIPVMIMSPFSASSGGGHICADTCSPVSSIILLTTDKSFPPDKSSLKRLSSYSASV